MSWWVECRWRIEEEIVSSTFIDVTVSIVISGTKLISIIAVCMPRIIEVLSVNPKVGNLGDHQL